MTPVRVLAVLALPAVAAAGLTGCDPLSRHHGIECDQYNNPAVTMCVDGATGHDVLEFPTDLDLHRTEDWFHVDIVGDPFNPGEKTISITASRP